MVILFSQKQDELPEDVIKLENGTFDVEYEGNALEGFHELEDVELVISLTELTTRRQVSTGKYFVILPPEMNKGGVFELKKVSWDNIPDVMYDVIFA